MFIKKLDFQKVSELIMQVSEEIILPRHKKLTSIDISEKKHGELVTIADTETEQWLSTELKNLLPNSVFIGEEDTYVNQESFKVLEEDNPVWIIDPIDGTNNFASGSNIFAVIVALVYKREVVAGWIYEPLNKTLAQTELGSGVFIGTQRISFDMHVQSKNLTGVAPQKLFDKANNNKIHIKKVYKPNCAGHEYIQLLLGERHFTAYTRLRAWDHAAGVLMINEAGGCSALLDGRDYQVTISIGNLLSTCNKESWDIVQSILV